MKYSDAHIVVYTREIDACYLATAETDTQLRSALFALKRKWIARTLGYSDLKGVQDIARERGDRPDVIHLTDMNRFVMRRG